MRRIFSLMSSSLNSATLGRAFSAWGNARGTSHPPVTAFEGRLSDTYPPGRMAAKRARARCTLLCGLFLGMAMTLAACGSESQGDDDSPGDLGPSPEPAETDIPAVQGDDDATWGEWGDVQTTGFFITGSYPENGAQAVPVDFFLQARFSEPYGGELSGITGRVTGLRSGKEVELEDPEMAPDGLSVGYRFSLSNLAGETAFMLDIEVAESPFVDGAQWPLTYHASFSSSYLCGITFDVLQDLVILKMGNNKELPALATAMLDNQGVDIPTALIFEGIEQDLPLPEVDGSEITPDYYGFPTGVTTLVKTGDDTWGLNRNVGISTQITESSIDAMGAYTARAIYAVFPIQVNTSLMFYLPVYQLLMTGDVSASGNLNSLKDFRLTGVVLGTDLINLLTSAGLSDMISYLEFDVDTDGDTFPDAASIELSSTPEFVVVDDCDQ